MKFRWLAIAIGLAAFSAEPWRLAQTQNPGQNPTQTPGNELAIIDIKAGAVKRRISLGQYTRPHGAMFMPGDESRVVVTRTLVCRERSIFRWSLSARKFAATCVSRSFRTGSP